MSGGYFDYNQYRLNDLASEVERLINKSNKDNEYYMFNDDTIKKFQEALNSLNRTAEMVQRIDWLVSGDDGEETFHQRWKDNLEKINNGN